MGRTIINIRGDIDDQTALERVLGVVGGGKVSGGGDWKGAGRKQYCYASRYRDGIVVSCPGRYAKDKSERFDVYREAQDGEE